MFISHASLIKEQRADELRLGTVNNIEIYANDQSSISDTMFYRLLDTKTGKEFELSVDVAGEMVDLNYVKEENPLLKVMAFPHNDAIGNYIVKDINKELEEGKVDEKNYANFTAKPIKSDFKYATDSDIGGIDTSLDPYEDRKEIISQVVQLIKSSMPADNGTIKDFIRTHYDDIINLGDDEAILDEFQEFLSKGKVDEKKGTDHDKDGDIDGDDYKHAKDKAIKKAMGKDKVMSKALKENVKAIITKVLEEDQINEAATNVLAAFGEEYAGFDGMKQAINQLENIVTDIEQYYDKTRSKIQKIYDTLGEIRNEEGLKVGGFLAPAVEQAFNRDLRPVIKVGFTKGLDTPKVKTISNADFAAARERGEIDEFTEEAPKKSVFTPVYESKNKRTPNSKMLSEAQASKELQNFGKEVHKKLQIIKAFKFQINMDASNFNLFDKTAAENPSGFAILGQGNELAITTHPNNKKVLQDVIGKFTIANNFDAAIDDSSKKSISDTSYEIYAKPGVMYFTNTKNPGVIDTNGVSKVIIGVNGKAIRKN